MAGKDLQAREERLKAALRENLKRRKAQTRGREVTEKPQMSEVREPKDTPERRD